MANPSHELDRLHAMLEHPHAAHAIAALSDDELRAVVDEQDADEQDSDEFADPEATDIYHDPELSEGQ